MADFTRLIQLLVAAATQGGANFVATMDKLVGANPEVKDEWAALRPIFVRLQDTGELTTIITAALIGAFGAIIAGKGTIGGSHAHHG